MDNWAVDIPAVNGQSGSGQSGSEKIFLKNY
jgi:hypothetical protein